MFDWQFARRGFGSLRGVLLPGIFHIDIAGSWEILVVHIALLFRTFDSVAELHLR